MTAPAINPFDTDVAFRMLPIAQLMESPWNTRKHFDKAKLDQLADNIGKHGVLTPLLARPASFQDGDGEIFEIAAGHRRYRAAMMAGVSHVPVRIISLDDVAFLEVLTIENLQREDIHELEEAAGYVELMKRAEGYDVPTIASKVGKSEKYIYDRIKLLQLIPELQAVFLEKQIEAGHAIILARLLPSEQRRAAEYPHGGLWQREESDIQVDLELPAPVPTPKKAGGHGSIKAVSVRELQHWVNKHVRFDASRVDPVLFPDTAATIAAAQKDAEKIVSITHSSFVQPEAKNDGERTFGPQSWKRADGLQKSKTCDWSTIGVIVVGEGRGESFLVCTNKQKCTTHWGQEIRAREARASSSPASSSKTAAAAPPKKSQYAIEEEKRQAKRDAYKPAIPAIVKATVDRVKTMPIATVIELVLGEQHWNPTVSKLVPAGKTAESVLRHLAFKVLHRSATSDYSGYETFPKYAKEIGLDLSKILTPPAPVKAAAVTSKTPVFDKTAPKAGRAKKVKGKRQPNAAFMKPMQVSVQLAAIVGAEAKPRTEITKKLWSYIKKHGLQSTKERRLVNTDEKLAAVVGGKKQVSMFEMTKHVNKHVR